MTRFTFCIVFLFSTFTLFAQTPNDCVNAIVVCGNGSFTSNASGIGNIQEVAGCSGFEHNSLWIKINIVQSGTLGFILTPSNTSINVDYDFWVYAANQTCISLGPPLRCCTTNPGLAGLSSNVTGMVGTTTTTTSGPGANGNGFVRWLDVLAGQSYYIAIDRPVGDGGFELQWTGSAMNGTGAFPVSPTANSIPEVRSCSVTPNVGIFNLDNVRPSINSDLLNNTITFYTTAANAIDGVNPLPNIYGNTSNPQTVYAKVKNNTSGCSTVQSFVLKVYPVPDATITTSATAICNNSIATITFTGTPNAQVEYTVNGGTVQSAILNTSGIFQITAPITVTTSYNLVTVNIIDATNGATICSRTKNQTVVINVSNPAPPTCTTNSPLCYNDIGTITINGLANATVVYTIDGGTNQSAVLSASGQQQVNLPGLTAGNHSILVSSITDANAPNCTTNTNVTATLVVQPQLITTIAATNSVCSGTTATVTFTGIPNAVITYTVDGSPNQTITLNAAGTATLTTPALVANSTYQLVNAASVTPICNLAQTASATILVTGLPTVSISGTTTICSGSTTLINFTGTPGATVTYTINGGANQTLILDASGNASLTSTSLTADTTYALVSVATTCTNAAIGTAMITIVGLPTATISPNVTICNGTSTTITCNGTPNAVITYTINGGANQIITLNASGTAAIITPLLTTTTTYALVSASFATAPFCVKPLATAAVVTVLSIPTAAIVANAICSGTAALVTFSGTQNAIVTYTVDGSPNQTITLNASGTASLTTPILTSNSSYQLVSVSTTGTTVCTQNLSATTTIVVTSLPTVAISGTTTICSGGNALISFAGTPNATVLYTVNGGTNQTIVLNSIGNASITTPTLTATSTYALVSVTLACSNTVAGNAVITVLQLPTAAVAATTICTGTSGTVTFTGTANAVVTYTINGSPNQTITLNGNGTASVATPILLTNSTYTLVGITLTTPSSSCSQSLSSSATVLVTPIPNVIATPTPQTICSGQTTAITLTSSVTGTSFSWIVVSQTNVTGATAGTGATIINTLTATNTSNGIAVYSVTPIANGCSGSPIIVQAIVKPLPTTSVNNLNPSFCSGGTSTIQLSSSVAGATFSWTVVSGTATGAISGSGNSINQTLNVAAGTTSSVNVVYEIIALANGCNGLPQQVTVTVTPSPNVIITNNPTPICSGQLTSIILTSSVNTTIFNWTVLTSSGVSGATSGSGSSIQQLLTNTTSAQASVTYEITPSASTCVGTPQTVTVLVNPTPIVTATAQPPLCSGETTSITISSSTAATIFDWTVNAVNVNGATSGSSTGISTVLQQTLTTTGTSQGYVDYTIIPKINTCAGTAITIRVYVNPLPKPVLADGSICKDASGTAVQNYTLNSGLNNTTYDFIWYFNGVIIPNSNNATYTANAVGTYSVVATHTATSCVSTSVSASITSTVPASSFIVVQSNYFSNNATLTANVVGGAGTFMFSLDSGPFQLSNVFNNVSSGNHTITVIDMQGCTNLSQTVFVLDYPHFFTPNGDGINDEWFIAGLKNGDMIYIFDRYGKLIKLLKSYQGWDGTYNEEPLPSDDYWFSVNYQENGASKKFKSHFALKR